MSRSCKSRPWIAVAGSVLLLALVLIATTASGAPAPAGQIGPSLNLTGNGRLLSPIGRQTPLGNFPTGGAITPDGRFYWVVDAGHGSDDVKVLDIRSGAVIQTLPLPGGYVGVAFSPDGLSAYVSGEAKGGSPTEGPTKGDGGDVVHVFSVDPNTGRGSEQEPISVASRSGGSGQTNSLPPVSASWPEGLAVSPDGRRLVVALNQADQVAIIDLASRAVRLVKVGAYPYGVAISPSSAEAYVSNELDGTISVVNLNGASVSASIPVGGPSGDKNAHPEGLISDPHSNALYVAVANRDQIAVVDRTRRSVSRYVSVGRPEGIGTSPVGLALSPDGRTLYSANAGEDAIAAVSLVDRPTADQAARLQKTVFKPRSLRSIVTYVRRLDAAKRALKRQLRRTAAARRRKNLTRAFNHRVAKLRSSLLFGTRTRACSGQSRKQDRAYAARVLAAYAQRTRALRHAPRNRRAHKQVQRRFFQALARAQRALRPIGRCGPAAGDIGGLPAFSLIGKLPTAAYPTAVEASPATGQLLWVAGKGYGSGPNPDFRFDGAKQAFGTVDSPFGTYVLDKLTGRAGVLTLPTDTAMRSSSAAADAQVKPSNAADAPAGTPVVGPGGGPSRQIQHVFYIVRENRTYDQVFGRDPRGDGAPNLELFGDNNTSGPASGITPNAHALSRQFPLLDHFYANSEVSVDGHLITAGAYATDYVQKATAANYSGRPRAFDFGIYPVSFPPKAFIFDQAVRQGISFRNYGEQGAGDTPAGNDGRSTFNQVVANTDQTYAGNLQIGCLPNTTAATRLTDCTQDSGLYGPNTTVTSALPRRFDVFNQQFGTQLSTNSVPTFNYMILPNDHTNGSKANTYSASALIADNDLALGQIVDRISHSSIWPNTAIFVVEDDSQDGADHVDSHRMPAFVISPWAVKGAVHTRYDQYSALRTAELMTGLQPLALNDALATPMYDAFTNGGTPDVSPYTAIEPQQSLTEANPAGTPAAKLAARLPFDRPDLVPQEILDRMLWRSVYGPHSHPPLPGPNASLQEHQRALGALRILRSGGDARAWLKRGSKRDTG